jgi:acetyl esterase
MTPPTPVTDLVVSRGEAIAFTTAMNLPEWLQRRLAGRPIEIDGQTLATDTQLMLKLGAMAGPAVETLPIDKGRVALLRQSLLAGGKPSVGAVSDHRVLQHRARLYTPTSAMRSAHGPLLVFFHGGGFVYGDIESHDAGCRFLAERSGVRVLSVEYRLGPECPFPAAADDAVAVFEQVIEHAGDFGADPARIGAGGDSAGGNLAAGVALALTDRCAFQLLIYPVTQFDEVTRSRNLFGTGFFLTDEFIEVAGRSYVPAEVDPRDPRLAPLHAEVPDRVAPAYLCTAGFDPLRDEGEAYAEALAAAGVPVHRRRYAGLIHGFLDMTLLSPAAEAAVAETLAAFRDLLHGERVVL